MRSQHVHVFCMLLPVAAERLISAHCFYVLAIQQLCCGSWHMMQCLLLYYEESREDHRLPVPAVVCPAHPIATTPHLSRIRCGSVHKFHDIMEM